MVERFLSGKFKDKAFEAVRKKKQTALGIANAADVDEEKEHEGYYPNELDQEMTNYTWGEKLMPAWHSWGWSGNNSGYANDYLRYWSDQGTFAPPYKPNSHFEAPYYHYPNKGYNGWAGGGYWGFAGYDGYHPRWALLAQADNSTFVNLENSTAPTTKEEAPKEDETTTHDIISKILDSDEGWVEIPTEKNSMAQES